MELFAIRDCKLTKNLLTMFKTNLQFYNMYMYLSKQETYSPFCFVNCF